MSRKKIIYMYLTASAVSAVIFILSLGMSFRTAPVQLNSISSAETSAASSQEGYVLKEYDGCLALFRSGSSKPYRRLDFNVSMLTDFDRELLKNGIYVQTEAELNKLIEDFIS